MSDTPGPDRLRQPCLARLGSRMAPVAQRIEHLTTDQKVGSSSLSGRAPTTRVDRECVSGGNSRTVRRTGTPPAGPHGGCNRSGPARRLLRVWSNHRDGRTREQPDRSPRSRRRDATADTAEPNSCFPLQQPAVDVVLWSCSSPHWPDSADVDSRIDTSDRAHCERRIRQNRATLSTADTADAEKRGRPQGNRSLRV